MTFNVRLINKDKFAEHDLVHEHDNDGNILIGYRTKCGIFLQHKKHTRWAYCAEALVTCLRCLGVS